MKLNKRNKGQLESSFLWLSFDACTCHSSLTSGTELSLRCLFSQLCWEVYTIATRCGNWEQQGCRLGSTSKSQCGTLLIDFRNPVIPLFLLLLPFLVKPRAVLNPCKSAHTQLECLRGHLIEHQYKKPRSRASSSQRKACWPTKVNGICFFTDSAVLLLQAK